MAEKILSCFIDESGDFGPYDRISGIFMKEKYSRKSTKTINNRLKHLIELGLINAIGNKHDPGRVYEFNK